MLGGMGSTERPSNGGKKQESQIVGDFPSEWRRIQWFLEVEFMGIVWPMAMASEFISECHTTNGEERKLCDNDGDDMRDRL